MRSVCAIIPDSIMKMQKHIYDTVSRRLMNKQTKKPNDSYSPNK